MLLPIVCALLVVGLGAITYLKRREFSQKVRIGLILAQVALVAVGAVSAHHTADQQEKVWHADAVSWKATPVPVWFDRAAYPEYEDAFVAAVNTWNARLNFKFFRITEDRSEARIVFKTTDGSACGKDGGLDGKAAMSACLLGDRVIVQIRKIDSMGTAFRQFLHELGHAIGLDHDDDGAMAIAALEPVASDAPEYMLPNRKDIEEIVKRYR